MRALIRAFSSTTAAWAASAVATPSSSALELRAVALVARVQPGDEPALEHDRHRDEGADDRVPGGNADGCRVARDLADSHRARLLPGEAQHAVPHRLAADRGRGGVIDPLELEVDELGPVLGQDPDRRELRVQQVPGRDQHRPQHARGLADRGERGHGPVEARPPCRGRARTPGGSR